MVDEHKEMLERLGEAEGKYFESFTELSETWHKLKERIRPFVVEEKDKEAMSRISTLIMVIPLAHFAIGAVHMSNLQMMKLQLQSCMPPPKITCPDCKKVVWDVTDIAKLFGEGQ